MVENPSSSVGADAFHALRAQIRLMRKCWLDGKTIYGKDWEDLDLRADTLARQVHEGITHQQKMHEEEVARMVEQAGLAGRSAAENNQLTAQDAERTDPLTGDDYEQIAEGIKHFICDGDPDVDSIWQPYIDKLRAAAEHCAPVSPEAPRTERWLHRGDAFYCPTCGIREGAVHRDGCPLLAPLVSEAQRTTKVEDEKASRSRSGRATLDRQDLREDTPTSGAPAIETLTRQIVTAVIDANTAGEADNRVRKILEPLRRDLDVDRYDHSAAVHAKDREREYRRTLWALAVQVWPLPLRVAQAARDNYAADCDLQTSQDFARRELLIYGVPPPRLERTPTEQSAVVPGDGAHPEALRAPAFLASELLTLRAAITRLTAENEKLAARDLERRIADVDRDKPLFALEEKWRALSKERACPYGKLMQPFAQEAFATCAHELLAALAAPRAPQEPNP